MQSVKPISELVVRLGEDFNWWLAPATDPTIARVAQHGVLDPRQVRELLEQLPQYHVHGLDPQWFDRAFRLFAMDAEIGEGSLRLVASDKGGEAFALPVLDEDGDGPYQDFLDALAVARVRCLNAERHYARACTVDEMWEELDALDRDRYFSAEIIHAFDQINEILQWSPAEWDQP